MWFACQKYLLIYYQITCGWDKMKKILLLAGHDINILEDAKIEADICDVYKKGKINKVIKRFKKLLPLSLEMWKKKLSEYSIIILFDTYYNDGIFDFIFKHNSNVRIIFYCWNSINEISSRTDINRLFNDSRIEIWSYNSADCAKYGLMYNPQFWNTSLMNKDWNTDTSINEYDISFIGSPKNRINIIQRLNDFCNENNLISYFYITDYKCNFNKNVNNEFIPYNVYIKKIASRSSAILDIVTKENYGLTLRPLEALFLKKKLITNYKEIVNEPFYNSNNIYVIDVDERNLLDFLSLPLKKIPLEIVNLYNCDSWLNRFLGE